MGLQGFKHIFTKLYIHIYISLSVGKMTGYVLDGPGIESRCGRVFPYSYRPVLGPPSLLCDGYRVFNRGKAAGACS